MTFCGAGQVQLALILDLRRRQLTPEEFAKRALQSIADSIKQRFNLEVLVNLDDVGLFDAHGAKLASYGASYKNGILGGGVALNFCMDLSGFDHIEVCGARRRMGNIMDQKLSWDVLAKLGQQLAQDLADNLTKEQ
jgi:lipoate-protein ligase B